MPGPRNGGPDASAIRSLVDWTTPCPSGLSVPSPPRAAVAVALSSFSPGRSCTSPSWGLFARKTDVATCSQLFFHFGEAQSVQGWIDVQRGQVRGIARLTRRERAGLERVGSDVTHAPSRHSHTYTPRTLISPALPKKILLRTTAHSITMANLVIARRGINLYGYTPSLAAAAAFIALLSTVLLLAHLLFTVLLRAKLIFFSHSSLARGGGARRLPPPRLGRKTRLRWAPSSVNRSPSFSRASSWWQASPWDSAGSSRTWVSSTRPCGRRG